MINPRNPNQRFWLPAVLGVWLPLAGWAAAAESPAGNPAAEPGPVLSEALAGPLAHVEDVVFAVRLPYDDPHWYANIGYYCDDEQHKAYAGNGRPDVGRLCKLQIRTGKVTALLDAPGGSVRDPQVHYDARKVLFSFRPPGSDHYHLYEIGLNGQGLRQITSGDYDDYEPAYLPDGRIVFVSTRCNCWVNCWMTQVGVLYRCDADGGNIERVSYSPEHDNTPWVLPDGRILYTRWEYVDRSQVDFHHLWTMNPDGTSQMVLYGNMHPRVVMIDAKPIPHSNKIVASFSPGHGVTDHKGIATVLTPAAGPDQQAAAVALHERPLVEDPYPLSEDCFLAARGKQILVMNGSGETEPLLTWPEDGDVREPRPVVARPRERVIPDRADPSQRTGRFVLTDVYHGRNMAGVRRGEIRKLLVLEILPKQVNFSGGQDLTSWLGTFTLERVLGTVPVEPDGSAYFEAPAGRPIFFVALDEHDLSVKRMQSFTNVAPGEVLGCVGCHESRTDTPESRTARDLLALRRAPSPIDPFEDFPDVLDFHRDVQPILDKHCVACHDYDSRSGNVLLTGDLGPVWSHSYFSLLAHRQVADGHNGLGNQPPRALGSSASALLEKLQESHYEVKVSAEEWRTVWLWIESGAPYAGSYAGLRNKETQEIAGRAVAAVFSQGAAVLNRGCRGCHAAEEADSGQAPPLPLRFEVRYNSRGTDRPMAPYERIVLADDPLARFSSNILLNFSRPSLSPLLLGPLAKQAGGWGSCGHVFADTDDPDYRLLLAALQKGKAEIDAAPRYATPGFRPNRQYIRELKRYGVLPASFDIAREELDVFQADQAYWKSVWLRPQR